MTTYAIMLCRGRLVSDMIKPLEENDRMSFSLPYTARCLTLFNPLWGWGREGEREIAF